jgi:uncharacterized membrane protein YkvI
VDSPDETDGRRRPCGPGTTGQATGESSRGPRSSGDGERSGLPPAGDAAGPARKQAIATADGPETIDEGPDEPADATPSCAGEPATVSASTLASVYVGTVIGAGFASGQEALQFFALHGTRGFAALAVAAALLGFFGYLVVRASCRLEAVTHGPVLDYVAGPALGRVIDGILTFFLFGATAAMFAGTGATLEQEFGLPFEAGLVGMAVLALGTVLAGIEGVVKAVSVVVPFLLATVIAVSLATLVSSPLDLTFAEPTRAAVGNWLLSGATYASYNLVVATSVLVPVVRLTTRRRLVPGTVIAAAALGLGALAVVLTILANVPEAARAEVPMLLAARRLSPVVSTLYTVILTAAIYTTAVSTLFGFVNRLLGLGWRSFRVLAAVSTAAAVVGGRVGFSTIVGTLFPAVGYAGLLFLGALLVALVRGRL